MCVIIFPFFIAKLLLITVSVRPRHLTLSLSWLIVCDKARLALQIRVSGSWLAISNSDMRRSVQNRSVKKIQCAQEKLFLSPIYCTTPSFPPSILNTTKNFAEKKHTITMFWNFSKNNNFWRSYMHENW